MKEPVVFKPSALKLCRSVFPVTGFAAGLLVSVGLTGCGQAPDEHGRLDAAIKQLNEASQVALPDSMAGEPSEVLAQLMAVDQVAARREALKTAEASLQGLISSGNDQEKRAAGLLLTRVRIADAAAAITQVRAGVPQVVEASSAVRTQALGFEAAFNQVVRMDPKIEGFLKIMADGVARERAAAAAVGAKITQVQAQRDQLKANIAEHQAQATELGNTNAKYARELMVAEGRDAFIVQNAMDRLTLKISAEQTAIVSLQDQVRLLDDQIALLESQVDASASAADELNAIAQRAEQAANADITARDAFRQALAESGTQVAESVNAMVDAYGVGVREPLQDVLASLEDASATDELTRIEVASARLEAMAINAMALQTVVDTLRAVESLSEVDADGVVEVGSWRKQALAPALEVANSRLPELNQLLTQLRGAARQLADDTREQINPLRGDGENARARTARNYDALITFLERAAGISRG